MAECDEGIIAEIISDFSIAINEEDSFRAYRLIKLMDDYLKGKKCDKVIIERALRILNSLELQANDKLKKIIDEMRKVLLKPRRSRKKKTEKKTKSKSRSRRTRRRRTR